MVGEQLVSILIQRTVCCQGNIQVMVRVKPMLPSEGTSVNMTFTTETLTVERSKEIYTILCIFSYSVGLSLIQCNVCMYSLRGAFSVTVNLKMVRSVTV